jgi:hypothetical protein
MLLKSLIVYIIIGALIASAVGAISLTVRIDSTSPTLTIKSPTSSQTYVTNANSIDLGGNASDDVGVIGGEWINTDTDEKGSITVASSWSQGWTISDVVLVNGANRITVKIWDAAGNRGTATLKVILDINDPFCTITSPTRASKYYVNSTTINLGGIASDNLAVVSVDWINNMNSAIGTANGTNNWTISNIPLSLGYNDITISAHDAAGNVGTSKINVSSDLTAPTCVITSPTSGTTFITNYVNINIGGTASDNMVVTKVNWTNHATGISRVATGTTTWTIAACQMAVGSNPITVTAWDSCGNSKSDAITINYDPNDPTCSITTPTSGANYLTNASTINIGGTAADSVALLTVNWTNTATGASGTATGTTTWTITGIALVIGTNHITVKAWDTAGNVGYDTITVTRDSTKPICWITAPANATSYITNSATIDVKGNATDGFGVTSVTWSNNATVGSGTATGTNSWTITGINLNMGSNLITVIAWDAAGNAGVDQIRISRVL